MLPPVETKYLDLKRDYPPPPHPPQAITASHAVSLVSASVILLSEYIESCFCVRLTVRWHNTYFVDPTAWTPQRRGLCVSGLRASGFQG